MPDGRIDPAVADQQWAANTRTTAVTGNTTVSPARVLLEHYRARLAKLEYEERVGKLVPKDEVVAATFTSFRQMRDALLNLPDRLAATIAAEKDVESIRTLLVNEILAAMGER
jgi:hypothetical protein